MSALLPFVIALLATAGLTPVVRCIALRTNFVDRPSGRRFHARSVALGGGVALVGGIILAAAGAILNGASVWPGWMLPAGLVLVAVLGLVDDHRGMHPVPKFALQGVAAALLVAQSGIAAHPALGPWIWPVAVFWVVGLVNACNFLDNMDGLLAGVACICGLAFLGLAVGGGAPVPILLAATLAGATLGFLLHNFPPARIFMGDAGSLVLGYLLASISLAMVQAGSLSWTRLSATLLVLGYPLFDITFVTITRLHGGRKFYLGGRDHTSHRLNRLYESPRRTALTVYALTAGLAALGLLVVRLDGVLAVTGLGLVAVALGALGWRLARVPHDSSAL